jgi:hypothetical protein
LLRSQSRRIPADRRQNNNSALHKFGSQRRKPIVLAERPSIFDGNVLALNESDLAEASVERGD